MSEIEKIKKALEQATPGPFTGFENYTNADIFLAINAPSWLRWQADEIERLNKEIADFSSMYFRIREEQVVENGQLQQLREELEYAQKMYDQVYAHRKEVIAERDQVKKERDEEAEGARIAEDITREYSAEIQSLLNQIAEKDKVLEWYAGHRFDDGEKAKLILSQYKKGDSTDDQPNRND